jgi:hypothetical protein
LVGITSSGASLAMALAAETAILSYALNLCITPGISTSGSR